MTLLSILATFFGVIMSLANGLQAIKIYKRKSAKDIAITTYILLFIGAIVWILYGIEIENFAIIISNSMAILIILFVFLGWMKYN